MEGAIEGWQAECGRAPRYVMLLGATPELALMRWLPATRIVAVDSSPSMLREVWPGPRCGHAAVCAEWARVPIADASQDVIVGDGCFSTLRYPRQYEEIVVTMRRVLCSEGMTVLRFFVRPEASESVDRVLGDLFDRRIGNVSVLKWRLAMALHGSLEDGVLLSAVWDAWHAAVPSPELLAARLGWPASAVRALDVYRNNANRYTFPTLTEARAAMAAAFLETGCSVPSYELGERCPTLVFRPR